MENVPTAHAPPSGGGVQSKGRSKFVKLEGLFQDPQHNPLGNLGIKSHPLVSSEGLQAYSLALHLTLFETPLLKVQATATDHLIAASS